MLFLVYASLPLSPRRLGTSRPKAKRLIVFSRRYAPKNTIRLPPCSGEADAKEESNQVLYLYTHLCVSLAGFFAKSHMMFFSCHHSCSAHRSRMTARVNCVSKAFFICCAKKNRIENASRPRLSGKVSTVRLTEGASMNR